MFNSFFRVLFSPISLEMYRLFRPYMTVYSKINIFGLVALHLNTCIELESILEISVKKMVVLESMKVEGSNAAHWLCTKNVIPQVPYPIGF